MDIASSARQEACGVTREFVWILGALGAVIALEYALGIEPRSAESLLLIGGVLVVFTVLSAVAFALRRDR
jgi:hypothetical protein